MRARIGRAAAVSLAVTFACQGLTATAIADDSANWMRDYVRNRQQAMLQQILGNRTGDATVQPRIIGGNVAPPNKWPFQVALLTASIANNANAQFCGGSLIGARHVLTAAHCVDFLRNASKLHVLTGTQSLKSGGTRQQVASFKFHPKWNDRTSDYDIAVITLKNAVNAIKPAALLTRTQETQLAAPGKLAYVTGWGDTVKGGGTSYPTDLHEVQVPIVSRAICNGPRSYDGDITIRMVCAGYPQGGKDSCQGDSGGPLIVRDAKGRWRVQAGIVSFGQGCALKNFYGVYSRVAVLGSWVKSIVNSAGAAAQAEPCALQDASARGSCLDRAIASTAAEMGDYLDAIRRGGSRAQSYAAEATQRAWSRSLAGLCSFGAATGGEAGHKACVLREMRQRAATLAQHLSEIDG